MKNVSECKKLSSSIENVVRINITILSKQEYYDVQIEYEEIINASVITKRDDAIDDVWNIYNSQKVPNRKRGKFKNGFISEDYRQEIISSNNSRKFKDNFP